MTFRLYFNRCEDWPQIWSIDCGAVSSEANVRDFRIEPGCTVRGGGSPYQRPGTAYCADCRTMTVAYRIEFDYHQCVTCQRNYSGSEVEKAARLHSTREPVAWCAIEAASVTLEDGVAVFHA